MKLKTGSIAVLFVRTTPGRCLLCLLVILTAATFVGHLRPNEASAAATKAKRHRRSVRLAKDPKEEPTPEETLGDIDADLTVRAEKGKPFAIDVWLSPKNKKFNEPVTIFMEQTAQMKYEPRVFTIQPGERKTIQATVLGTSCGLAPIKATAANWEDLDTMVDTGFDAKLKANIVEAIDSGVAKTFNISLVDNQGKAVSLDTDLVLTLQGSKINLKTPQDTNWHEQIVLNMREGTSSTQPLNIQSDSLIADRALISAQLQSDDFVVHNSDFWIDVKPRWYVPLLMAILGGIIHATYKLMKERSDPQTHTPSSRTASILLGLLLGAIAGGLAYLLVDWGVLGIKVDTTTLQGFVILGFLFSYVGVDFILKTVTKQ